MWRWYPSHERQIAVPSRGQRCDRFLEVEVGDPRLGFDREAHDLFFSLYVESVGPRIKASLTDTACWVLSAITSGIIGNLGWESVKAVVRKLRGPDVWRTGKLTKASYEAHRIHKHGQMAPQVGAGARRGHGSYVSGSSCCGVSPPRSATIRGNDLAVAA